MSFLSGLKVFGHGVEKVFGWMTSPKGQAVIAAGEGVAVSVGAPPAFIDLFNEWAAKAANVEAIAVAASQASGTAADKAALAIQGITPTVLQYAQQEGLQPRTADQIQKANDAVVQFINAMTK